MKMLPFDVKTQYIGVITVFGTISPTTNKHGNVLILNHPVEGTLEEWLPRIEAHNNACLAADKPPETFRQWIERGGDLKEEPADPFAYWPVKPGDWVEYSCGVFKAEEKESGVISIGSYIFSDENLSQLKDWISAKLFRILTPAEVEAHERKLNYPVLAPGDAILQECRTTAAMVEAACDTNLVRLVVKMGDDFDYQQFTQDECRTKLESGEWVKYVREVKP